LMQLVALMKRASLVIANDSGPMHIAAALDRPLVTLFGPTNPVRTGPFGHLDCVIQANMDCVPCYRRKCPRNHECLREMTIEPVLKLAERQLSGSPAVRDGRAG
jgi:ADP-heptose:LPS heptosyltransferase